MLADPLTMLKSQLDDIVSHLEIEDDCLATVRVNFGTAQIPAAFGCKLIVPGNNLPAAAGPLLESWQEIDTLSPPPLDAGWYGKLESRTIFGWKICLKV